MSQSSFQKYLVDEFHVFFDEVYRLKQKVITLQNQPEEALSEDSNDQRLVESMQRKLRLILEEQTTRLVRQVGDHVSLYFEEARYIMAALADEVFLSFEWFGHDAWRDNMLESQLFKTQVAGEHFFQRLDNLITHHDPTRANVAAIYLLALGLGFRGKYRDQDDLGRIQRYREQLFQLLYHHPNSLFQGGRDQLIFDCYAHTLTLNHSRRLPDVRRWVVAFMGVLLAFITASSMLWYSSIRDLGEGVRHILNQTHHMPRL
jgi:type VI secretion system protein ImpK